VSLLDKKSFVHGNSAGSVKMRELNQELGVNLIDSDLGAQMLKFQTFLRFRSDGLDPGQQQTDGHPGALCCFRHLGQQTTKPN